MNKIAGSLDLIKRINRSLVLEKIKAEHPISRSQISKELKISKSTVSNIVDELLRRKLITDLGEGESTRGGGRKAQLLGFNPKSAYGVGVDIGGTKILVIVTDWAGEIVYKDRIKTTTKVEEIMYYIKSTLKKINISEANVIAMGIGVPGTTDIKKGIIIGTAALGWENLNLRAIAETHFSFPVFINNDVNCAALGERWLGAGERSDDILFIAIGTGVGSAIISNGSIIYGHSYKAGEIGYQINESDIENNINNDFGKFGAFESKISGTALSSYGYTSEEVFIKFLQADRKAVAIVKKFINELSIVIVNAVNLLNPKKVIIGGGVSESMNPIVKDIQSAVDRLSPIKTEIKLADLGGEAGALGAISYAFDEVQESNLI